MRTIIHKLHNPCIVVALLTVLFASITLPLLGVESLEPGEGESWGWATRESLSATVNVTNAHWHPPAYFAALGMWLDVFDGNEFLVRLPAWLMGLFTVPLAYLLGRFAHSHWVGVLTALLWGTSPMLMEQSMSARHYAMFYFGAALSLAALAYIVRERRQMRAVIPLYWKSGIRWGDWRANHAAAWFGLFLGLSVSMFTHYGGTLIPLFVAAMLCTVTALTWFNCKPFAIDWRNCRPIVVNSVVCYGAFLLLWILHPFGMDAFLIGTDFSGLPLYPVSQELTSVSEIYGMGNAPWAMLFPLLAVAAGIWQWSRRREWVWLAFAAVFWCGALVVAFWSLYVETSVFRPRVFYWTALAFYPLVAVGIVSIRSRIAAVALLVAVLSLQWYSATLTALEKEMPWRGITGALTENLQPGDALFICPSWIADGLNPYEKWYGWDRHDYELKKFGPWMVWDTGQRRDLVLNALRDAEQDRIWMITMWRRHGCPGVDEVVKSEPGLRETIAYESVWRFDNTWPQANVRRIIRDPFGTRKEDLKPDGRITLRLFERSENLR